MRMQLLDFIGFSVAGGKYLGHINLGLGLYILQQRLGLLVCMVIDTGPTTSIYAHVVH